MKILIDLTSLYDNCSGIERYAKEISIAMISQYYEHQYVLVFKNEIAGGYQDIAKQDNVRTVVIKSRGKGPLGKLLFNQVVLPSRLYKIKADAYLFPAFPEPLLFVNKKIYTTIHDLAAFDVGNTMTIFSRWYFRISYIHTRLFARRIITVSRFSAKRINEVLKKNKKRIWIIRDGVNAFVKDDSRIAEIKAKYKLPDEYMLSLATLEPRKNLVLILWAYDELLSEGVKMPDLVLAGRKGWKVDRLLDGFSKELREKTHITGFVEEEDLAGIYGQASFFVNASVYEGFGLPPLEAMSMGVPVLSSDIPAAKEVLGNAAMYFESDNVRSLKEQLKEMLTLDEDEKKEYVYMGRCRARRFKWDDEARNLMKRLERMKR